MVFSSRQWSSRCVISNSTMPVQIFHGCFDLLLLGLTIEEYRK